MLLSANFVEFEDVTFVNFIIPTTMAPSPSTFKLNAEQESLPSSSSELPFTLDVNVTVQLASDRILALNSPTHAKSIVVSDDRTKVSLKVRTQKQEYFSDFLECSS